jgi:hypothetical protein
MDLGVKKTPACAEVARRYNKTPRAIEKAYEQHHVMMSDILNGLRDSAESAIDRSRRRRDCLAPDET